MNANELVYPGERVDDLGLKGLFLIQDPKYFCFGVDAVLLSDYAKVHPGDKVMDLCTGNGIIPVLLAGKTRAEKIIGIEIQKALADMANRSVEYNLLSPRVEVVNGDIREIPMDYKPYGFDVVTVNPPYMSGCGVNGAPNEKDEVRIARHEELCNLSDVLKAASHLLRDKGRFYMIHRPLRLVEILGTMSKAGIEPKAMRLVHPYADKEPNMVLIEGIKGAMPELRVAKPLIVYESPGVYTREILEIYGKS